MELHYFAWVRERIGKDSETLDPPTGVTTPAKLADWLCGKGEEYRLALGNRARIKVAVNQDFADWDTPIRKGDEVAFFPPVTGG